MATYTAYELVQRLLERADDSWREEQISALIELVEKHYDQKAAQCLVSLAYQLNPIHQQIQQLAQQALQQVLKMTEAQYYLTSKKIDQQMEDRETLQLKIRELKDNLSRQTQEVALVQQQTVIAEAIQLGSIVLEREAELIKLWRG